MNILLGLVHAVLYMATAALAYLFYGTPPEGMPQEAPDVLYTVLGVAVVGVSVVIAVGHVIGGGLMGLTAGGVWNGMKMGLLLGLGMAFGRLWPYLFIVAAVGFICHAPVWHWVVALVLAAGCFAVNSMVKFIWSKTA